MVKHVPANAGDKGSISGLGRPTGKVNGNLLQYSCLEKSHGQRTCWATVHGVARESGTTQKLNNKRLSGHGSSVVQGAPIGVARLKAAHNSQDWQGGAVYQLGLAEGYGLETLILPSWVSPQDAWASSQHGGWFPRVSTRWMCRAIFFLT